ncbi:arylsulfate sulfotransferase [Virgibacillus natechei]|uniref:Arylsulfate sulfotransferase n=1 Tax=Virgibacillus natechei TaxID=1216297 RepID=A0ABS4IKK6_9BACI|nr:aryl-sulfate sulfotransferase [Virgibacillus natechei]MBP1971492.1 arylsulfate sulfotransferase [Virgibacillus natechei]UZD12545.1 aryl-sulfate sulfotransferase [Virgibacillus natechei]
MKKRSFIYLAGSAAIIVLAFVVYVTMDSETTTAEFNPEPDPNATQFSYKDERRMFEQTKMEEEILANYNEGTYSFEDPFVKVDPYEVAPLTALVKFETEESMQISMTVEGKDSNGDMEKTFEEYQTAHEIPVLGLYADHENTVILEATNEGGETITTEVSMQTEGFPDDFLTTELVETAPEKMEEGLTFIIPSTRYVYAVDHNADVRWYSSLWNSHLFKRLDNGNVLYLTKEEGQDQYNEILEMDMLGKVFNSYLVDIGEYDATNVVHHDVIEFPNGNLLATTHDTDSDYVEDEMTEIDRETGETVRNFSFRDIFPASFYEEYDSVNAEDGDWFHQNTVAFDESDNTLLITSRHQDLNMKMSYPDGEIKWLLAAHEEWPEEFEQYLLEPVNDVKFPGAPHAIMLMPDQDGNDNTNDYLLFDNNMSIIRADEDVSGDYSRAIQYRINEEEKTVEEVWSYGEERGTSFYSNIVGDADYLYNTGNRLITSGHIEVEEDEDARISRIVEVTGEDNAEVVYEIVISGFEQGESRQAYRAERMSLYPEEDS